MSLTKTVTLIEIFKFYHDFNTKYPSSQLTWNVLHNEKCMYMYIIFSMSLENDFLAPFMAYKCAVYDYKKEDNAN